MTECLLCHRPAMSSGSSAGPRVCMQSDGETCRLWQVLNRHTQALTRLKRVREDYAEGVVTNDEFSSEVKEAIRVALDQSIPANSYFIGSWCGGEEGPYAKVVQDRDRLLRERDIADRAVEAARRFIAGGENRSELHVCLEQYDRDRAPRGPLTE